jgi:hypothetical protein
LNNCTLTSNSVSGQYGSGGGASGCTLNNCTLASNLAPGQFGSGGGAANCTLDNCTLTSNSAPGQFGSGGGASFRTLNNCILYFNTANQGANYDGYCTLNYCCTTPQPANAFGNVLLPRGRGKLKQARDVEYENANSKTARWRGPGLRGHPGPGAVF